MPWIWFAIAAVTITFSTFDRIGNDTLGLDIMARGVLQDWLVTLFNQYDRIAAKLLPDVEAAAIKPKIVPPIGEPLAIKRGAKVNLIN